MFKKINKFIELRSLKRIFIGRPLKNEDEHGQKFGILSGLPILASDAVSSVAYASEAILGVLLAYPLGLMAYSQMSFISAAIIGLLVILVFSYRHTIENYPNGGGAYIVASENIGKVAGVTAGAALAIDYILTVAVSISAATSALTSAFNYLIDFRVPISLGFLLVIMIGNLRGIRESSRIFSIPAYAFTIAILSLLFCGIMKITSGYVPPSPSMETVTHKEIPQGFLYIVLLLSAFSNGCSALTGVEAVSNAVPSFRKPSTKNAKIVLIILAFVVFVMFGGVTLLANLFQVDLDPEHKKTVLANIAHQVFGYSPMFYFIQAATMVILALAANTAYSGFPMLFSVMAKDGYVPRQLHLRGDRLSYSNGIILLSVFAASLIIVFQANVELLIPLYAIGVFVSFTLSQSGMFMRWIRLKSKGWKHKAIINGFGAFITLIVVLIISITKFVHGAWIVIIVIPPLVYIMLRIKRHYNAIANQLRLPPEEICQIDLNRDVYRNRVIVPIESVNKASIRAIRYAKTISDNIAVFNVSLNAEDAEKLRERYKILNTDIPLIIKYSPFRKVVEPLLKFIESAEYDYKKGDMITVIMPQFGVSKWWHNILHNHSRLIIERQLLKHKHIVVSTIPLQLKDDKFQPEQMPGYCAVPEQPDKE